MAVYSRGIGCLRRELCTNTSMRKRKGVSKRIKRRSVASKKKVQKRRKTATSKKGNRRRRRSPKKK